MKKIILSFFLIPGIATIVSAQDFEDVTSSSSAKIDVNKVRFGGYFAPVVSWMKPTAAKSDNGEYNVTSGGSKVGYVWGLMTDYFFAKNYGISTGFQINTWGGSINSERTDQATSVNNTVYNADFNYTLQYLEVPFQLKLRSDEIEKAAGIKIFGQIGLTGGVNIGKKATYKVDYSDDFGGRRTLSGDREKISGSFAIAPVLLQLNVGGGVEKPITNHMSLYFGLFFNNAFLPDVTNPNKYDLGYKGSFSDGNIRLNSFALRFGLFF